MTVPELARACAAETVLLPDSGTAVTGAYTSDLLSDVMAHAPDGCVLITVQNHTNTIAVCTLVGAVAVLVCHGRDIPDDMRAAAAAEGVALLRTPLDQFRASLTVGACLGEVAGGRC